MSAHPEPPHHDSGERKDPITWLTRDHASSSAPAPVKMPPSAVPVAAGTQQSQLTESSPGQAPKPQPIN